MSVADDDYREFSPTGRAKLDRARMAAVPFVPWDKFNSAFKWRARPGSHITLLGPTGQGKTTLALELLKRRRYVVVVAAKPSDPALERLQRQGFVRIERWPSKLQLDPDKPCRILFWPQIPTIRQVPRAVPRYEDALDQIMRTGGWTVYIDEGLYASTFLGLKPRLEDMWQRARTQDISLMFSAQRSANVPLLAYDQVDHIFTARENDRRNAERIGEMAGRDRLEVREIVQGLKPHQFLYIGVRDDLLCVTKAPAPGGRR